MLVAIDPITQALPEGEDATFLSPPISVGGASDITVEWFICSSFPSEGPEGGFSAHHRFTADTTCTQWSWWSPTDFEVSRPDTGWTRVYYTYTDSVYSDYLRLKGRQWADGPAIPGLTGVYVDRVRVGTVIETSVPSDGGDTVPGVVHASPNPFGGRTVLSFSLIQAGPVSIRVYDLSGRVVRTLVNEALDPGAHEVPWDGSAENRLPVASGIYFALLDGPGVRDARKLVLMR
jgi:hypothetical protein